MAQQIPTPILQLAWLLYSLIDQNPHQNADVIRLLNSSIGQENPVQLECSLGHSFEHFGSKPRSEPGNPNGSCG